MEFKEEKQCYARTTSKERCKIKVKHELCFCAIHEKGLHHGTILTALHDQNIDNSFLIEAYIVLMKTLGETAKIKDTILFECLNYIKDRESDTINMEVFKDLNRYIIGAGPTVRSIPLNFEIHEKCIICWGSEFHSILTTCCANFICSECWVELENCPICFITLPKLIHILLKYYDQYAMPNLI